MLNRKFYKVRLSGIDFDTTRNTVSDMRSSDMIDIINNSCLKDLGHVIVYKTLFGHFRELITGKEIAAITESLKAYSESEHVYYMTKKVPIFFKCNTSFESETGDIKLYDINGKLKTVHQKLKEEKEEEEDIEDYLRCHLGVNKDDYSIMFYEHLSDLNTMESDEVSKYNELLSHYGLVKTDRRKAKEERKKIKALIKKYNN